jgi:hypothetical protein
MQWQREHERQRQPIHKPSKSSPVISQIIGKTKVNRYRGKGLGLLESLDIGCLDGLGGLRNLSGQ